MNCYYLSSFFLGEWGHNKNYYLSFVFAGDVGSIRRITLIYPFIFAGAWGQEVAILNNLSQELADIRARRAGSTASLKQMG